MKKLIWVNHASYIIETPDVRLICDPWIEGKAFDNGWSLLSKTKLNYEDFKDITHIWFSHEHPDHFSPPNIMKIPEEYRRQITVLYQESNDGKVIQFCKKAGFKTQILPTSKWVRLSEDFEIICTPFSHGDSWMATKFDNQTILNLNDCVVATSKTAQEVQKAVGKVDILLTQFSYAKWYNTQAERQKGAADVLDRVRIQNDVLKPEAIIPFASFIYFCDRENQNMNDSINTIADAYQEISSYNNCPVFYPGDEWNFIDPVDSQSAIDKYMEDANNIEISEQEKPVIPLDELLQKARKFLDLLYDSHSKIAVSGLRPVKLYITDLDQILTLSPHGLETDNSGDDYNISISSSALAYMFDFTWGGGTLLVNGKFQSKSNVDDFTNYAYMSVKANVAKPVTLIGYLGNRIRKYYDWYSQKLVRAT